MFVIIWRFQVKPDSEREFERIYGRNGEWVTFFRRSEGYRGTELLRDLEKKGRYITIDRWRSQKDFEAFKNKWISEYGAIDRRCERLTDNEQIIGLFEDDL